MLKRTDIAVMPPRQLIKTDLIEIEIDVKREK